MSFKKNDCLIWNCENLSNSRIHSDDITKSNFKM